MVENTERKYSPDEEIVIREAFKNSGIQGPKETLDNLNPETMVHLMVHFGAAKATLRTGNGSNPVQGTAEIKPEGSKITPTQIFKD